MNLTATWSITDDDLLSFEQSAAAIEAMAEEIDHEILCDTLIEQGWALIKYPAGMRKMSSELDKRDWCTDNCSGRWQMSNRGYFIFESEKDAAWFALRWS